MVSLWTDKVIKGEGARVRTVQIALAVQRKTPAGMLGQGVQHVVEEADARADADDLGLAGLRRMAVCALGDLEASVGLGRECAAVEVERELDLGLVCVARKGRPARGSVGGGHCRSRVGDGGVELSAVQTGSKVSPILSCCVVSGRNRFGVLLPDSGDWWGKVTGQTFGPPIQALEGRWYR